MAWQMAIAAVAHMYVFSAEPYHYLLVCEYGKVTKAELKLDGGTQPAVIESKETQIEAPGTSITESVQDIVLEGGQRVSYLLSCMFERSLSDTIFVLMWL